MEVSNGIQSSEMEFYINTESLVEFADALEAFPKQKDHVFLWEIGSETPEDRWAYYLRLRAFTLNSTGHCAIQIRWNNNESLPDRVVTDFCIKAEAGQINRLGELFRKFAKLEHQILEWSISEGKLLEKTEDANIV
jgi:hypothetical protein